MGTDGVAKPGVKHLWISIAFQICIVAHQCTGKRPAYLALGAPEPQPESQRVAQQWGRGLLGGALLNPLEVLGPGGGHAIW